MDEAVFRGNPSVELQQASGVQFDPATGQAFMIDPYTGQKITVDPNTGLPFQQGAQVQMGPTIAPSSINPGASQQVFLGSNTGQPVQQGGNLQLQFDPGTGQSFVIDPVTGLPVMVNPNTRQQQQQQSLGPQANMGFVPGQLAPPNFTAEPQIPMGFNAGQPMQQVHSQSFEFCYGRVPD